MTTTFWRSHQLLLDPWAGEYELPVQLPGAGDPDDEGPVDLDAEPGPWEPRYPGPDTQLPLRLAFIDGRRRLDARVLGRADGEPLYGAFATIGVGGVLVDRAAKKASFMPPRIRRVTAIGSGKRAEATPIGCPFGGPQTIYYEASLSSAETGPDVPLTLVQLEMLAEEGRLAKDLIAAYPGLTVIRDGPLRDHDASGSLIGYTKTMAKAYLPSDRAALLWTLPAGARSPLFTIGNPGARGHRWSWYLRTALLPRAHGLAGVVRLELDGTQSLKSAREAADQTAALLPAYASEPHRDPRAPQNLTPVGALEREIGRHMGDAGVIRRRVSHFLATEGAAT